MAFFKFRVPGAKAAGGKEASAPAESVDVMRRRARHRLIGAFVLVMAAVIGFPLVFDTQPRPVAIDVTIQIPDRAKTGPLQLPASAAQPASVAGKLADPDVAAVAASRPASGTQQQVAAPASLDPKEELVTSNSGPKVAPPSVKGESAAIKPIEKNPPEAAKAEIREVAKPEVKAEVKPLPKPQADDGARARALLEGRSPSKVAPASAAAAAVESGRFIVQIGAFADSDKARETRMKVERAGLTTYTQVVETPEGKRTRVRVGPFTNRAEADNAAAKIRALDLPAAILTL